MAMRGEQAWPSAAKFPHSVDYVALADEGDQHKVSIKV
jgi:hypothetical protein